MTDTGLPESFDPQTHGKLPRVACTGMALGEGISHALGEGQAHHLRHVLRLAEGESLRVFNAADGEWLATLRHAGKRGAVVEVTAFLRKAVALPDIWLVASPLKKDALDVMVEKASELGARRLLPVIADHTAVHRMNIERAQAQAVDAAEQCERCDVMEVAPLSTLSQVLENWPQGRALYVALERSAAMAFLRVLRDEAPPAATAVLVGPEGGFSQAERARLLALPFVRPVSLGETILRAETAAVTALSLLGGFIQAR